MPPKVRVSKEDIIQTALKLVRQGGEQAINARAIAKDLGCSTQPVFYNFESMDELAEETRNAAFGVYLEFIKKETEKCDYPRYKSMGIAYIRFANEEKELFKLLFMRDRTGEVISPSLDFEEAVAYIINASGLNREAAVRIHMELWSCVHGIAVMTATLFLSLEWEFISDMLSDVYVGVLSRYTKGEKQ